MTHEKIAAGIGQKLRDMKTDEIVIDSADWEKSQKKPQIVDLWHAAEKANHNGPDSYNRSFPFPTDSDSCVRFHLWGQSAGMGPAIAKRLKALKVKFGSGDGGEVPVAGY